MSNTHTHTRAHTHTHTRTIVLPFIDSGSLVGQTHPHTHTHTCHYVYTRIFFLRMELQDWVHWFTDTSICRQVLTVRVSAALYVTIMCICDDD